jgi:uridylate kinase
MLRRCTLRAPSERDTADLVALVRSQREVYAKDPEAAKKAVAFGDLPPDAALDPAELAAWTLAASVVLNLDDVLNKR